MKSIMAVLALLALLAGSAAAWNQEQERDYQQHQEQQKSYYRGVDDAIIGAPPAPGPWQYDSGYEEGLRRRQPPPTPTPSFKYDTEQDD